MTNLLQLAIDIWKIHQQTQSTLQIVSEERVSFVWFDVHVSLCDQQYSKFELSFNLVYLTFVCKLLSSSKPINKNQAEVGLEIQTTLLR